MEETKVPTNSTSKDETPSENVKYIWFGVYNELLLNENISKLLERCNDKTLPKEQASIHLNKFSLSFNKNKAFILFKENSSIFIKLYLITKNQLIDIMKNEYKCTEKIENDSENIFKLQNINDEFVLEQYQAEENFYNTIKKIGVFNEINIYSVTTKNKNIDIQVPDKEYLHQIYIGLKQSFYLYSDYLIMYYLYLIHEIKTTYSLQKLTEIFFEKNKEYKINNENKVTIKEIENQKQFWYFLPKNEENKNNKNEDINEYNYILNMETLPEFDETTGEFFWNNNDSNWEKVNQKINSNIEIRNKVVNIENGSVINIIKDNNINKKEIENNKDIPETQKNTLKKNTLKYIEELSNILDTK